jgi:hypothetical protein
VLDVLELGITQIEAHCPKRLSGAALSAAVISAGKVAVEGVSR